jgi:nucleoid DNA-binding protein
LEAITQSIEEALSQGEEVSLIGFGTFKVTERAARTGRNPKTGETMQISASKSPSFKAGKALKEACNQ